MMTEPATIKIPPANSFERMFMGVPVGLSVAGGTSPVIARTS
jgi:hypothetical protein